MYVPELFKVEDLATLHGLMRRKPFATLVSHGPSGLVATHLPTVLKTSGDGDGPLGTIECHLARPNSHWQDLADIGASQGEALMIFQGAEGYITPAWYPSKAEHGKVVPTWNYATVHAYGVPGVIDDASWKHRHVSELSRQQERERPKPWAVTDAPEPFVDMMLRGFVGFRFVIKRLEGKWKMSQNRAERDRAGVVEGLKQRGHADDGEMVAYVAPARD